MRAGHSRPRAARRVGGLSLVAAIVVAAALVAVFMVSKMFAPQHESGLAGPSQVGATTSAAAGGTGPAPASSAAQRAHARASARHARASARSQRSSGSPAPASASPAPPADSPSPEPSSPASPSPAPSSPGTPQQTAADWLITKSLLSKLSQSDAASAKWFFNSPDAFVKGPAQPGLAATPLASYTSYAQFAQDLADGSFPAGVKWVMFGIESTTDSPLVEKQNPAVYLKDFAVLAHEHGLRVIEVPGQDLMGVPGAACRSTPGEPYAQAFVRCGIPADARYADAFLIEAQGNQTDVSAYSALVKAAASQVRAVAPNIRVMSGLTTDRGDSAAQIYACWKATRKDVSGYWMNSTSATLPVAAQALDLIRAG